jgi:hypothetical protein
VAQDTNANGTVDVGIDNAIQSAEVCNGADATVDNPFMPAALVNPCGDAPGIWDEIFLRLANGQLVASFSDNANGNNTRFSILTPGTYETTDGDNCMFTVDNSLQIINESHHY